MIEETNALPTGFSLHRYQIESVLGAGGFGITYRAIHEALQNQVAIKEYFPAEWAYRDHDGTTVRPNAQGQIPARSGEPACYDWGLQRFLDEAKILVQINHPCVVRVRDYFTANGSAYIVMEYEDGESLSVMLQRGGILPEHELRHLLDDVTPALEAVHGQGYLHRDLKPSNLYIRSVDGRVMLIDFGAARQALGRRTRSVTSVVTPGYSPIEQYVTVGEDYGPWTDIYALGAVLYRCITGAPPIEAPGRVLKDPVQPAIEVGAGLYSRALLRVVDQALAVRPEDRFQTVAAMREALRIADQANERADFSQVPRLQPELLELAPLNGAPRLEPLPTIRSKPSAPVNPPDAWSDSVRPERRPKQPRAGFPAEATPSRPSQRTVESSSAPGETSANWTLADFDTRNPSPPAAPRVSEANTSLPLLENIWEHLDEPAPLPIPPAPDGAGAAEPAACPSPEPPVSLLKRSAQSAVERLGKAASHQPGGIPAARSAPSRESSLPLAAPAGREQILGEQPSQLASPSVIVPSTAEIGGPPIKWRRVLLAVFAISGLSGTGLLTYEYYQAFQEQRRQEAAAQRQRQQQEEEALARHAREEDQRREADIAGHIEQFRSAMANRAWGLADNYLARAAALNPNHPAVVAARSELLAAQRPGTGPKTRSDNKTGLELNWIEGGCFTMGSPSSEQDRGNDESTHQVCVKGFWIGVTEITNGQFRRFKPEHDSGSFQGRPLNRDAQPAVNLSWDDAKAFTEWLSWEAGTGKRFRLPTEAEWEYAARAGAATRYYWGNNIDPRYANFSDRNDPSGASIGSLDDGQAVTAPVGGYLPNTLGLRDMAGNVWEWTCSEYDLNYGGQELGCSDKRLGEGLRVARGGSWNNGPGELRSARRLPRKPGHRDAMTGFRVVMEE